jgi:alpha-galactosidase
VHIQTETERMTAEARSAGVWQTKDVQVVCRIETEQHSLFLTAVETPVRRVFLRWRLPIAPGVRFLGDHWERGYGDLEWRGIVPERPLPWYFLTLDGRRTEGVGVRTNPGAFAFWQADSGGVTLTLDVRCGGEGVRLGGRTLRMAEVVGRESLPDETPFAASQAFCRRLCPVPRLPDHPVYGSNDWYYRYGNNTQETILEDARLVADLCAGLANRPYVVTDAGWQASGGCDGSRWDRGNARFPDMPGMAASLRAVDVRPGIWIRPLHAPDAPPNTPLLPPIRARRYEFYPSYDPSHPDILERVASDIRRLHDWGYALIKHDFTTVEILGRWGFDMGTEITSDGWAFYDRTKTSAEIIRKLYETIREAAGTSLLIGCNTMGHLGAGLFELQRTGDDTSGREWERTRKMGVNTLAFRMNQHGAFYFVDADCVGLTNAIPWELNRQWLDLLARSGTPLFVSAAPDAVGGTQKRALRRAFAQAAQEQPVGVPRDWLDTTCPTRWILESKPVVFDWQE